jgi:predicted transposase YdaD
LDEWISFLKTGKIPDKVHAKGLAEARERLRVDMLGKSEKAEYNAHMEALRYQRSVISTGIIEGKAEGRAEGKAEGKAEGRAEGKAEGRAEGIAEGKAEGRAEGIAEGLKEGEKKKTIQIVLESNKAGLPVETIAAITQLTPDEIVSILKGKTIL